MGFKHLFELKNQNYWTPDHVWGLNITLQKLVAINVKDFSPTGITDLLLTSSLHSVGIESA